MILNSALIKAIRYMKPECYLLYFLFILFLIYFSILNLRLGLEMSLQLCYHTSVTLDDTVNIIVISHKVIEKNVEGSRRMIL